MTAVRLLTLGAVVLTIVLGASAAGASSPDLKVTSRQECPHGVPQYTTGPEVVFGRVTTEAAASGLRARVARTGFTNASIEQGCSDFRVVVRGYDTFDTAVALQREANRTPFRPTVECYQAPDKLGEIEVVLGNERDLPAAQHFAVVVASRGFVGAKLESDACGGYEVMLHGFSSLAQAQALVPEAVSVGFHPRIEPNS